MADAGTHVFRASLRPKLYREFEIPSERKLYALAKAIVAQFGFYFGHPFGFYIKLTEFVLDSPVKYELFADTGDDSDAGSVERTRIDHAFPTVGDTMTFLFDYGDNWQFRLEAIGRGQKEQGVKYPRLVKKVGKAPEQYPAEGGV